MNFPVRFILLLSSPLISSVATAQTVVKYISPSSSVPRGAFGKWTGRDEGAIQSHASGSVKTSCQNGACTP